MRDFLAILACHIIKFCLRLVGRRGGTFPGEVALKISPDILRRIKYTDIFVIITGTNGKTGTTSMLRGAFEAAGKKVVSNRFGDNLIYGAASTLLAASTLSGKVRGDAIILELDELTLGRKFDMFKPTDVVLLNFFRDQLDRYGEMASVTSTIEKALEGFGGRVFYNADDPSLSFLHLNKNIKAELVGFGMTENYLSAGSESEHASEGRFCPVCGSRLDYSYYQYSHIGDFKCHDCGFKRHEPEFLASLSTKRCDSPEGSAGGALTVSGVDYSAKFTSLYQYYNEVAVIAVAMTYGIDPVFIEKTVESYNAGRGRMEQIGTVLLNLVKNPTGLNLVLRYIASREQCGSGDAALLFVLNDSRLDGRDVSWIWDADIPELGIKKVILSGERAYDMALRFKYSHQKFDIEVIPNISDAARRIKELGGGYALSVYSTLLEVRRCLK